MFRFKTDFLKMPLYAATSTDSIQSLAFLSFLVPAFSTSVTSVLWEWKFPTLSTGFRTCSIAPIALVAAPTYFWVCGLPIFLVFSRFSIFYIVHLGSLLHSIKMVLCRNFQSCYLHHMVQGHFIAFFDHFVSNLFTCSSTNDSVP